MRDRVCRAACAGIRGAVELLILFFALGAAPPLLGQCVVDTLDATTGLGPSGGESVAIEGDQLFIGATDRVEVRARDCARWELRQILWAPPAAVGADFAEHIQVSGDVLAVSASDQEHPLAANDGAVYIYRLQGASWVLEQELTPPIPATNGQFGGSLSLADDRLLVGQYGSFNSAGRAYTYVFTGGSWVLEQSFQAPAPAGFNRFGFDVAIDGPRLFIGELDEDLVSAGAGAVHIYEHTGASWSLVQTVTPVNGFSDIGREISASGDVLAIGRQLHLNTGAVFVFRHDGASFVEEQTLFASDGGSDHYFGRSVEVHPRGIAVGAPMSTGDTFGDPATSGAVYFFEHQGGAWLETLAQQAATPDAQSFYGLGLAVDDLRIYAGGPGTPVVEEIAFPGSDCDGDFFPDECAIAADLSLDCNLNGVLDSCDIASGASPDGDGDGVPDECTADCDGNGIADSCDPDCDQDGEPDACEIATGAVADCNANGVPDPCDLGAGTSSDVDGDSIPDECEPDFIRGDCNDDATFDLADAVFGLGVLFLMGVPSCGAACDANGDELLDIADPIYGLAALFLGLSAPPPPFPTCGPDPGTGVLSCPASQVCP